MDHTPLIARVRAAFPDPGWAAEEDPDDGAPMCLDRKYIKEHYHNKRWCEISSHELGWMSQDGWAFSEGELLYFLPAWIIDDLQRGWDHLAKLQGYLDEARDRIVQDFTDEQQAVLLEVLLLEFPEKEPLSPDRLIGRLLETQGKSDGRPTFDY